MVFHSNNTLRIQDHLGYLLLSISCFLARLFSVYIEQWRMIISLESLFLSIIGFMYGIYLGIGSAISTISVSFFLKNISFNPYFFLQPILIILTSSMVRFLFDRKNLFLSSFILFFIHLIGFGLISLRYPNTIHLLLLIPLISLTTIFFSPNLFTSIHVNMIAVIASYLISFYVGMSGAILLINSDFDLFLKARILKESWKIILFGFSMPLLFKYHDFE